MTDYDLRDAVLRAALRRTLPKRSLRRIAVDEVLVDYAPLLGPHDLLMHRPKRSEGFPSKPSNTILLEREVRPVFQVFMEFQ